MNSLTEKTLYDRALDLYLRRAERECIIFRQPSWNCSEVKGKTLYLRNNYETLVRYRVINGSRLRFAGWG